MRGGRVVAMVAGALMMLAGFGVAVGGGALVVIHATQRDATGFYSTGTERFATSTAVLTAGADLGPADRLAVAPVGTVRVRATAPDGSPLFVGIAGADDVSRWLAGASYEEVTGLEPVDTRLVTGSAAVTAPAAQPFWVASASGPGTQEVTWHSEDGRWAVVVMSPDARPGVVADVDAGARTGVLLPIGLLLGAAGLLLLGTGIFLVLFAAGFAAAGTAVAGTAAAAPGAPGSYPVRLDGRLDTSMSRWLWLVKWVLVIPHGIVLVLLWLAMVPLTVVAGFAILFTGRYPRPIFDFNVGVMRWTWRVWYYSYGALGTDRYPPFSLRPDPSDPADLAVDYPQRLSRGLVLVKWWLLAIPHYLVVAVFAGGWAGWVGEDQRFTLGGGLVGLLVLVSAVVLLFTGRYPQPVYDFVMGMDRWCFRVLAYAALMRDEYPPFRLDTGGADPGTVPAVPVAPAGPTGQAGPAGPVGPAGPQDSGAQLVDAPR
ncbi:MAG TPA: DUF4389 domain-containing protein [Micromonosporaceae bacterium]|nr:DUF4389 domain-containing protein [Micromonosporaceae bacterium]